MRVFWPLLGALFLAGCGSHPENVGRAQAQPVREPVQFLGGDGQGVGYCVRCPQNEQRPGLVLVHGDYGIDTIREHGTRLALAGYVCVAVDLYRGAKVGKLIDAHIMDRGLPEERALGDLRGAVTYLLGRPDVRPGKVGLIGWGMGGGLALDAALADPRITAVVLCDGRLTTDADALRALQASVLGIYAEKDEGTPPETLGAFRHAMGRAGKRLAGLHVVPGCDRDFMTPLADRQPGPRDAEAAEEAWARIIAYLEEELH